VLLLGILQNVLTLAEIPAFWIDAVYGAIILIALVVSWATGGTGEES
jgi:simple sugar transport system permease protein